MFSVLNFPTFALACKREKIRNTAAHTEILPPLMPPLPLQPVPEEEGLLLLLLLLPSCLATEISMILSTSSTRGRGGGDRGSLLYLYPQSLIQFYASFMFCSKTQSGETDLRLQWATGIEPAYVG